MKQDIKERWVAALRSGEYKQGKECLKDKYDNSYCCLGVLAELSPFEVRGLYLSPEMIEWAGLGDNAKPQNPVINPGGTVVAPSVESSDSIFAANLNDAGVTFAEIADLIEEHL